MTDVDEGRRLYKQALRGIGKVPEWNAWCYHNAPAMFDEIEKGRQWEAVARRWREGGATWATTVNAFRELADPT